jgi:NAD(P)H-dependent FMN reductase
MKILAFAGSNSSSSINKALVSYASSFFENTQVLDLNDFETSIFSKDREKQDGIPDCIQALSDLIMQVDGLLLSLAEYNGAYSSAFKNVFDWLSRIPGRSVFMDKPILLMATSPGRRGGKSVLEIAADRFPRNGGVVIQTFSLPKFNENFDIHSMRIIETSLDEELKQKIKAFKEQLASTFANNQ